MTRIALALALCLALALALPAQARWVRVAGWQWRPDRVRAYAPKPLSRAELKFQICVLESGTKYFTAEGLLARDRCALKTGAPVF
jgi:hypothetical protein